MEGKECKLALYDIGDFSIQHRGLREKEQQSDDCTKL
jgi:hypothetical protein